MVVRPEDSASFVPVTAAKNYHSGARLMKLLKKGKRLAVFDTKTRDAAGVVSTLRVGYGPKQIWPSKEDDKGLCKVHKNMFHAVAYAGDFTSVHPDGTSRVPIVLSHASEDGKVRQGYEVAGCEYSRFVQDLFGIGELFRIGESVDSWLGIGGRFTVSRDDVGWCAAGHFFD
jgi:hypothetical protein